MMDRIFSSLKTTASTVTRVDSLDKLRVISVAGNQIEIGTLACVLTERRCGSALEELKLSNGFPSMDDTSLAQLVAMATNGLKTLVYGSLDSVVGPLTTSAILGQSRTLENLRISIGESQGFPSHAIQRLLCSAPRLKRFDTIPSEHRPDIHPKLFLANDIVESSEDWVCLELESFKCMIGGVPGPDLKTRTSGRSERVTSTIQVGTQKSRVDRSNARS